MPKVEQTWFDRKQTVYETPPEIFGPLNNEFKFTLDVCAIPENAKCNKYFTPNENGLSKKWEGVCWMNPPFGREMKKWVKKAFEEWGQGATVVALLPARTNTLWWHDWVMKGEVRFIKGEVRFVGYKRGLWMPMAVVVWKA